MAPDFQIGARKIASVNLSTGAVLREMECTSDAEVSAAVTRAKAAQISWANTDIRERIAMLREFQCVLHERKSQIAEAITRETGKPVVEALSTEVLVVLDVASFLIANAYRLLRDEPVPHENLAAKFKTGKLIREPYGVVGIISPWNYPFSIPATETLAALVAGNAVVLKPSELTSLIALELQVLLHAAGIPKNIVQVILGEGATGAALVHAPIDKLIFTGSVATGKRIASIAAERLLPVVLELGGKDPMIVLDDASVDVASSAAVWGAFMNAGQTCLSVERCYVHRSVYENFLKACVEKTKALCVNHGEDYSSDVGPLINNRQLRLVEEHVEDAQERGARILVGGSRYPELGRTFYKPTILAEVTHEMRIMREETFGPVLPVAAFDSDEQAISLANDSEFGLAASIWTGDNARGERMARHIQAGAVMVNDVISCFGIREAPHGGVKSSGLGRTHGRFGLEEMVRLKYIDIDRMPSMKKIWWYGYGMKFGHLMNGFLDMQFGRDLRTRLSGAIQATTAWRKPR
jgi:acyl-CoA reductase-like NAD-dependent aldehyde dehydrogenase